MKDEERIALIDLVRTFGIRNGKSCYTVLLVPQTLKDSSLLVIRYFQVNIYRA
jgi:hypothetical protein